MSEQEKPNPRIPVSPRTAAEVIGKELIPKQYQEAYFEGLYGQAKQKSEDHSNTQASRDNNTPAKEPVEELSPELEQKILSDLGRPFGTIALNPDVVQRPPEQPPQM